MPFNDSSDLLLICMAIPDIGLMRSAMKPVLSPTYQQEIYAIKTCDIQTHHPDDYGCVYCFMNPAVFSIVMVNENKYAISKVTT